MWCREYISLLYVLYNVYGMQCVELAQSEYANDSGAQYQGEIRGERVPGLLAQQTWDRYREIKKERDRERERERKR